MPFTQEAQLSIWIVYGPQELQGVAIVAMSTVVGIVVNTTMSDQIPEYH